MSLVNNSVGEKGPLLTYAHAHYARVSVISSTIANLGAISLFADTVVADQVYTAFRDRNVLRIVISVVASLFVWSFLATLHEIAALVALVAAFSIGDKPKAAELINIAVLNFGAASLGPIGLAALFRVVK